MKSLDEQQRSSAITISPTPEAYSIPRPWPLVVGASSVLVVLLLFWPTTVSLFRSWQSSRNFSHGFLIVPLFLYLIWIRRGRIAALRVRPQFWGLPLLLALGLGWLFANAGEVRVGQQFTLVAMLVATTWIVLGNDLVRVLRFPLAFLFFAVPMGESIIGKMQDFTAWFAVNALELSKIPAILENRTITVPGTVWEVAEACSGTRYLLSSLVLGLIFASLVYRSWTRRLAFVAASIVVPILANGVRAYGIILLGYVSNNKLAAGVDHIIYGFVFFTALQFFLFAVGLRWRETPGQTSGEEIFQSRSVLNVEANSGSAKPALVAAICALMLVGWLPVRAYYVWNHPKTDTGTYLSVGVNPPWRLVPAYNPNWVPNLNPDSSESQSYVSPAGRVDTYLAHYSGARGPELVSGYNLVKDRSVWFGGVGGLKDVTIAGHHASVQERLLKSVWDYRTVWICYWVAGEFTGNPERVKFLQAKRRLLGRPANSAVLAISVEASEASPKGQALLRAFMAAASPRTTPLQPRSK